MTRVVRTRNYGVFVGDERGERHHSPHCHVKDRGRRIASLHLVTLEVLSQLEDVPADVMALIVKNQEALLAEWERLNP
jgi:hypothetical protein